MDLICKYHSGEYLCLEQQIALKSSLIMLQVDNNLKTIQFWGKINCIESDYFILVSYDEYFKLVKYFYSTNLQDWTLMPRVKKTARTHIAMCNYLFTGVPSHVFEIMVPVQTNEKAEQFQSVSLKEEDRLAATVEMISKEATVIPRGTYTTTAGGAVIKNSAFQGVNENEAIDPKNYIHFEDLSRNVELFPYWQSQNTIDKDFPSGSWSLCLVDGGRVAALQSVIWPGLALYQQTNSPLHSSIYFGDGRKNMEICFMIT